MEAEEIGGSINEFAPPSLLNGDDVDPFKTYTYLSPVPTDIASSDGAPCILGVDEAGRGPVLGPMVYAMSYCLESYSEELATTGFQDSKVLTHEKRERLLKDICTKEPLLNNVGWAATIMSARDISSGMLRPGNVAYNLNDQAHNTTMDLIKTVVQDLKINVVKVFVDTVGPAGKYEEKLSRRFPGIKFTVRSKADSLYPIVSAASICAKVTRDASLLSRMDVNAPWGSGYPSDPNTKEWLRTSIDKVFGWDLNVRFSWQTAKDLMDKSGVYVEWPEDRLNKMDFSGEQKRKTKTRGKQELRFTQNQNIDTDDTRESNTRFFGHSTQALF